MSLGQTPQLSLLLTTILSRTPLTYSASLSLYTHLYAHASTISLLLTTHRELYFSDFEFYTRRLVSFLHSTTAHALSGISQPSKLIGKGSSNIKKSAKGTGYTPGAQTVLPVPEAFVTHLLLPLFTSAQYSIDEAAFVSTPEFLELITAVLSIYIPQSITSKSSLKLLHDILSKLLLVPSPINNGLRVGLLERFIASQAGGDLLTCLISSKGTVSKVFNEELLELYICRITVLVETCVVSHGPDAERALEEWVKVVILKSALESFGRELEAWAIRPTMKIGKRGLKEKEKEVGVVNLPDLSKMRALLPKSGGGVRISNSYAPLTIEEDTIAKQLKIKTSTPIAQPNKSRKEKPLIIEIPPPQFDYDSASILRSILGPQTTPPTSLGEIQNTLKALGTTTTFSILSRIVTSFPCSACSNAFATEKSERNNYNEEPGVKLPERVPDRNDVWEARTTKPVERAPYSISELKEKGMHRKKGKNSNDKGTALADGDTAIPQYQILKRPEFFTQPETLPQNSPLNLLLPQAPEEAFESSRYNPSTSPLAGPWRIVLSTQAMKDLQTSHHDGTFPEVKRILLELATGDWHRRGLIRPHKVDGIVKDATIAPPLQGSRLRVNKTRDSQAAKWRPIGAESVLKLYKAIYGKNHRVLWGIEGAWDEEWCGWRQVVKIWRIGNHKEILESVPGILRVHRGYSANFIRGCRLREPEAESGRYLPAQFALSEEGLGSGDTRGGLVEKKSTREEALGLHEAITTGKFYTLSQKMLESLQESRGSGIVPEFAFDVSEEETSIVRWWRSSVLVLGRSGTGKTTCLVFKLLAGYLARKGAGIEARQIFLTRSPFLAGKIRRYVRRLIESQLCKFDKPPLEVEHDEDRGHIIPESREDDRVNQERNLFTIEGEEWPLVCTFDEFYGLIEKTLKIADRATFTSARTTEIQLSRDQRRVDFTKFKRTYWPTIPPPLKKGISVDLVFAELMGIIKGGNYNSGFLPLAKEGYLNLSSRIAPTFLEGSRERGCIWLIYEMYEDRRKQLCEWDDLDRCRLIREGLGKNRGLVEKIKRVVDECFVDEVQDLRVGEVEILLRIIGNPRAVHLAGDTAQCISRDSTFRFQDVKALYFNFFQGMGEIGASEAEGSMGKPKLFLLCRNYRSHQGILALAGSVVELLWKVFPDAIDKLQPEKSQYSGPKPKLFVGFSSDIFSTRLFGVNAGESMSEFGAEQVILVRDDEAREALRKEIGSVNLILTIIESKGMEFEDVLLFNYFSGGPAGGSFRALVSMEEEGARVGAAELDRRKHAVLCAELKGLYVAVTRPRARLWLIEEFEENVAAMARLWMKGADGGLVHLVHRGDVDAADMMKDMRQGNSNKPADWYRKGLEFLEKKLWSGALQCFERAGDETGQSLSKAYLSEQKALDLVYENPQESKALFRQAALLFLSSEHPRQASKCFVTIQDWGSAAGIWEARREHERAATLYEKACDFRGAAHQYHLAAQFVKAATSYREGEHFTDLLQYLISHGQKMEPVMFRRFSRLVNALFRSRDDVDKKLKLMAIKLLGSDSEKEAFLIQYDMHDELIQHYVSTGLVMKAAGIYVSSGDYARAANLIKENGSRENIDVEFVDEIFRWTETKRLQALISGFVCHQVDIEKFEKRFLPHAETPLFFVSDRMREGWKRLGQCLVAWFRDCKAGDQDQGTWIDEDLQLTGDLLITTNSTYFGRKGAPREFPFQSVSRCAEAIKKTFRDGRPPAALARFYGISYIKDSPETVWILAPSPLLSDGNSRKENRDIAFKALNEQLSGDMAKNAYFLQEKAFQVLREESLCQEFAVKGMCKFRSQEGGCKHSNKAHIKLSREFALSRLELLNSSSEIMMALTFPYQNRLFKNQEYSKEYRGTVRKWLEQLLSTTTFVSEFITHPLISVASLYSTPRQSERGVRNALEDLLYHRIKRDNNMWNFSGLLEQMDLADSLNVGGAFGRFIVGRINWGTLGPKNWDSFTTFANTLNLRDALMAGDTNNAFEHMWQIFPAISMLDSQEMRYFHVVIAFWERCCAFLIVVSSPTEFLIKDNWRKGYFSYFLQFLSTYDGLSDVNREEIIQAARATLEMAAKNILGLLGKLRLLPSYTLTVVFNKRPDVLIRRVLDLLGLCLCNIQQPVGVMHQIRVFMTPGLESIIEEWNYWCQKLTRLLVVEIDVNKFMVSFADAFNDSYNGIETLCLFRRKDLRDLQSRFRMMKPSWKVKRIAFSSLSEFDRKLASRKGPDYYWTSVIPGQDGQSTTVGSAATSSLTLTESKAVSMIQAFWRRRWPLLLEKRAFEKTDLGKATKIINGLCKELRNPTNETATKRRLRLFILHQSGVPAYLRVMQAEKLLGESSAQMKVQMKEKHLKWVKRETLDERYLELQRVREEVVRLRGFFASGSGLVAGSVEDLAYKLKNIEAQAEGLWDEAKEITKIVD